MASGRVTQKAVNALRCPSGRDKVFLWDAGKGAISGFGVAALASGKKVFVVQYRQHGRSRRLKLGEHGRITLDKAESLAKLALGAVEEGKDPIEQRRAARGVRTFKEVSDDYLRLHVKPKRKERTYDEYERLLKLHIVPAIGAKPITAVTRQDVAKMHNALSDTPGAANRCLSLIDAVWNWAIRKEEIALLPSPTKGVERNKEEGRERFLKEDELRRLGAALRQAETTGVPWTVNERGPKAKHLPKTKRAQVIDAHAVAAIRLLMLTGARLREILGARWSYIDWDRGLMFLPDSKTGRKTVYLSDAALGVLGAIPKVDGNPHIIPGDKKGAARSDLKRPWAAIVKAAGLVEQEQPNLRLHDLRHTFASLGAGSSLGLPVIGKLLGHSQASTTQRYAHLDSDPMHRAANLIGAQIVSALAGNRAGTNLPQLTHASASKPKPRRKS